MVYEDISKLKKLDIIHEYDGREAIHQWRDKRLKKMAAKKHHLLFYLRTFNLETLHSFAQNFNFMVLFQMFIAGISVYIFQMYNIAFDLHVTLFVSPIVFPLAFSIDADFQRREKVLEDLAQFKSSGMVWYFCMRDWKLAAGLDNDWIKAVQDKLRSVLFHLREYLLTYKIERRRVILRAMYEDFSDMNQLIEKLRASRLPSNSAIISRSIHLLNMMCFSFERLRVIREYRSPRSIRSFNKVLIMCLPVILAPYYVHLGEKSGNKWEPYYISVLVAFVFSALQGVQDKLDDPFDGMSEDDINLDTFDEWNSSLEQTMKRTFAIGRFKVSVEEKITRKSAYGGGGGEKDPNINVMLNNTKNKPRTYSFYKHKYLSSLGLSTSNSSFRESSSPQPRKRDRRITIQTDRIRQIPTTRDGGKFENIFGTVHYISPPRKSSSFHGDCSTIPEVQSDNCEVDDPESIFSRSFSCDSNMNSKTCMFNSEDLSAEIPSNKSKKCCKDDIADAFLDGTPSASDMANNACPPTIQDGGRTMSSFVMEDEETSCCDTDDDFHTVLCEWNVLDAALRREIFASKDVKT